jgi:hypothetical protein
MYFRLRLALRLRSSLAVFELLGHKVGMPTDDQDDASFIQLCVQLDEPVQMLRQYVTRLRELKRRKKDARAVLGSMRLHAERCVAQIAEFERVLAL